LAFSHPTEQRLSVTSDRQLFPTANVPQRQDRLCLALLTAVALAMGFGPWLLAIAVSLASPGQPLPLDVSSQVSIAPAATKPLLLLVHAVVYAAVILLFALGLVFQKRHGLTGAQQRVFRTLQTVPWVRRALRAAATSSTLAFAAAILILAVRWRAA
jgi:hypothetical protein